MSSEPVSYPREQTDLRLVPAAQPRPEPQEFRTAAIGAVVGFVLVAGGIITAGLIGGIGIGVSLGLGLWVGFWGGGGFGFMLGGALPGKAGTDR